MDVFIGVISVLAIAVIAIIAGVVVALKMILDTVRSFGRN